MDAQKVNDAYKIHHCEYTRDYIFNKIIKRVQWLFIRVGIYRRTKGSILFKSGAARSFLNGRYSMWPASVLVQTSLLKPRWDLCGVVLYFSFYRESFNCIPRVFYDINARVQAITNFFFLFFLFHIYHVDFFKEFNVSANRYIWICKYMCVYRMFYSWSFKWRVEG